MRSRDFISELSNNDINDLKDKIVNRVKDTTDRHLLTKIFTQLSKSDLDKRLSAAIIDSDIKRDPDIKNHIAEISRVIADVPGPYDEKVSFLENLPNGYVNIDLLKSGKKVSFRELLTPKNSDVSIYMIERIFLALEKFGLGTTAKGPGEYALAILSPDISISGKGDLKIGDNVIEVKSSEGRVGTTGDLKMQRIPEILKQYLTDEGFIALMDGQRGLSLVKFTRNIDTIIDTYILNDNKTQVKNNLIDDLIDYIFSGKQYNSIIKLKNALKNSQYQNIQKLYTLAAYEAYQGTKKENFHGVLLINFNSKELQYFVNPEEMYDASTLPTISLISSSERNILPPLTLKSPRSTSVNLPKRNVELSKDQLDAELKKFAEKIINDANEPLSIKLVNDVHEYIKELWNKNIRSNSRIKAEVLAKFPFLSTNSVQPQQPVVQPQQSTVQSPAPVQNEISRIQNLAGITPSTT